MRYHCPKTGGRTADGMYLCADGRLCVKQQYCQGKRTYEQTPGIGACERRGHADEKQIAPREKRNKGTERP